LPSVSDPLVVGVLACDLDHGGGEVQPHDTSPLRGERDGDATATAAHVEDVLGMLSEGQSQDEVQTLQDGASTQSVTPSPGQLLLGRIDRVEVGGVIFEIPRHARGIVS
jgi:hypothetical protein